ncbi:MAG: hypothetical protein ABW174_00965 [Flavitalea sp.]
MKNPKFRVASMLIAFALISWAIFAQNQNYTPILWIVVAMMMILIFAGEFFDNTKQYERSHALIKGGIYPDLARLLESGDLTIIKNNDCKILDVTVDEYPMHLRSTISNDPVIKSNGRYLLCEKIYEGIKYQYVTDITHYSAKYLNLLLGSTQSFKLYVDISDRRRYHFETP